MKKTFQTTARGWVDGSTQTLAARAFRTAATLVSLPYSGVVRLRNGLYDLGVFRVSAPPRPTVSVGNLTLGGVGKTPFVGWLAEYFTQDAQTPAFISRGYQAKRQRELFARVDSPQTAPFPSTDSNAQPPSSPSLASSTQTSRFAQFQHFNDEARELALRFPSTPHFLGANRVEVAEALAEARPDVDVFLLDDAFQHRRIKRDLDVVLLDALNPFGGGRVFPAGFLREPLAGLARADVVLLNRADLIPLERRRAIRARVERFNPDALFAEIAQTPRFIFSRRQPNDALPLNAPILQKNASNANDANSKSVSDVKTNAIPANAAGDASLISGLTGANAASNLNDAGDFNVAINAKGANATFAPPCPSFLVCEEFATWRARRRGERVLAFCGLGAPNGFRKTLETNELTPSSFVAFPDHCVYSASDFASLATEAERIDADAILTTAKDFVKIPEPTLAGRPIFALGIGVEFLSGEAELRALLAERFPRRRV